MPRRRRTVPANVPASQQEVEANNERIRRLAEGMADQMRPTHLVRPPVDPVAPPPPSGFTMAAWRRTRDACMERWGAISSDRWLGNTIPTTNMGESLERRRDVAGRTGDNLESRRGCGYRVSGGLYMECLPYREVATPWILDPPIRVDASAFGLHPIGVKTIVRQGVTHVMDIVGEHAYQNVADFVEEAWRMGISRRLPRGRAIISGLTAQSMLLLLHRKAWIDAHRQYWNVIAHSSEMLEGFARGRWPVCDHHLSEEMCRSLWWFDVRGAVTVGQPAQAVGAVTRRLPSGDYRGYALDIPSSYTLAIFARVAISRLVVVGRPSECTQAWEILTGCGVLNGELNGIPVMEVQR